MSNRRTRNTGAKAYDEYANNSNINHDTVVDGDYAGFEGYLQDELLADEEYDYDAAYDSIDSHDSEQEDLFKQPIINKKSVSRSKGNSKVNKTSAAKKSTARVKAQAVSRKQSKDKTKMSKKKTKSKSSGFFSFDSFKIGAGNTKTRGTKAENKSNKKTEKSTKPTQKATDQQSARRRRKRKDTYTSVKNRKTRWMFNRTSGASARADFEGDKSRYHFVWFAGICLCVILVGRAFELQVVNAKMYQEKGNKFITSVRTIPTYRGMITDRNGLPLAVSAPLVTVAFNPNEYARAYYDLKQKIAKSTDSQEVTKLKKRLDDLDLTRLATITNIKLAKLNEVANITDDVDLLDDNAVKALYPTGSGSQYFPLLTRVPPEVADSVLSLEFKGVYKEEFYQRYYPQAFSSSQLLGYMGENVNDPGYKGRSGIEKQYQNQLAGKDGQVLVLRDAKRASLKEVEQITKEENGQDIQLTIDARLQFLLYQELEKVSKYQRALWSSGIIVDVQTGEVLALSTWPSYNANDLSQMTNESQRNRPLLDIFEPGSVMKPFTVAAALESGKYDKRSIIDTSPGSIKVNSYTIRDHANLGHIGFRGLLKHSSNVASTKIALSLPAHAISDTQRRFGFGSKTSLDFPGEQTGKVVTPKQKQTARRATVSYGYGLQVTLAQVAQAYAALGAGGVMHPLTLVKRAETQPAEQVISKEYALSIVEMMESVTETGGTAPSASIDGYRVAGKTGTSRRVNPEGGYFDDKYRTVFAGIAPVSNPRLVTVILVEDPKENKYAGEVSAPVFHNVMKEALRLYSVPLDKPLKVNKDAAKEDKE